MKNSIRVSLKRQAGSVRNTVIVVVALLIVVAYGMDGHNDYEERANARLIAQNMLTLPHTARSEINGYVARTGSLAGSGKGVAVPPNKMSTPGQELEWRVSDDGRILGLNNTFLKVTVEWTPAVQNSRVLWSCKVTFTERYSKLAPPPCPELL